MKSLKQQIQEKYLISKNTNIDNDDIPKIDEIAYDYNGESWKIIDFCKTKDSVKLKKLIDKYDYSGLFEDTLKEDQNILKSYEYIAVAENEYYGSIAIWVWGEEGICYMNKPN